MPLLPTLLMATLQTVALDQAALRSTGCSVDDEIVLRVPKGVAAEVKFAVAGAAESCYKVTLDVDGKKINGYLPASALSDTAAFERERANASDKDLPALIVAPLAEIKKAVARREEPASGGEQVRISGTSSAMYKAIELLENRQPGEALTVLESEMRRGVKDGQLLALAGIAAFRADRLSEAERYLRTSLELEPNRGIQAFYDRLAREMKADRSKERVTGGRFQLRYDGLAMSGAAATELLWKLEREYTRISDHLGCRTEERITTIVQTPDAYSASSGAAEWSGGLFDGTRIRVPYAERSEYSARIEEVLAHELVHACLASLGNYPSWLHEGMAQKLSGKRLAPGQTARIRAMLRQNQLPALTKMPNNWSGLDTAGASVAYAYAQSAVEVLYEKYASYGIQSILRNEALLKQVVFGVEQELKQ